ncbi:helix-turn-helix domain-containing protein [Xenorhabdus indica]|uniref:helix-turn-helix domain-containing protein n=1 Tax=Xenorhabdus indica TaxID=333964 RepID=UPI0030B886DD
MDLNDEVFDTKHAADFLKKSVRQVRKLIHDKRLKAAKTGKKGGGEYEILKSSCLEYVINNHHNADMSDDCSVKSKEGFECQSYNAMAYGTVISFPQAESELGALLEQRTRSKRRNCTTS